MPQPEPIVGGGAGTAEPAVVLDCRLVVLVAAWQDKNPALGLVGSGLPEPQQVTARESGMEELGRSRNSAGLLQILKNVHIAI